MSAIIRPKKVTKKGAIRGLGSMPSYTGGTYMSSTALMGWTSLLFLSFTGTSGYSSGAGSVSS